MKINTDLQDQTVFSYINSEACISFHDLIEFLQDNCFPLYERWAFYCLGKKEGLSDIQVDLMPQTATTMYGGLVYGEIFYWTNYLNHQDENLKACKEALGPYLVKYTDETLYKRFVMLGWKYVEQEMRKDFESFHDLPETS